MKRRYYKRDNLSTSLSGDNLLVFYYLSTSQIWPELPFFIQMVQNYLNILMHLKSGLIRWWSFVGGALLQGDYCTVMSHGTNKAKQVN
jgi:hypothetical protein